MLATCNRIEVFAEVEKFHGGVTDVSRVLARQAGATVEELSPYVTVHYEDQAVAHLFTVAAGLDSMVVGETQVLGQLRAAYALAREEGTVGRALHPVAQRALRVGKRVHTETGIDRAGASLVSVALDRAEDRIGDLAGRRVLVVGAGSMGALAATTLARRGADVVVSSRTHASPQRLATSLGGRAAELADAPEPSWPPPTCWSPAPARPASSSSTDVVADRHAPTARAGRWSSSTWRCPATSTPAWPRLPDVHVVDLALLQGERCRRDAGAHRRPGRRRRHRRRARPDRGRDRAAAGRAAGRRGRPDRVRAAQPGRRGRRRRAAPAVHPAARPRRPRRAPRSPAPSAASSTSCCTSRPSG